ncbi:MAG: T9SS type A sorting domain-containing protein [Taibaiella sp.]|nr:T9SS type A sorting domain-containing protein [Taibaiella sp.]
MGIFASTDAFDEHYGILIAKHQWCPSRDYYFKLDSHTGDTLWMQPDLLVDTFINDTLYWNATGYDYARDTSFRYGIASKIESFGNGNFAITGCDTASRTYLLKTIDSSGHTLATFATHACPNTYYPSVVKSDGNRILFFYTEDSVVSRIDSSSGAAMVVMDSTYVSSYAVKLDDHLNQIWKVLLNRYRRDPFAGHPQVELDFRYATGLNDGGAIYSVGYDTNTTSASNPQNVLQKLNADGTLGYIIDLQASTIRVPGRGINAFHIFPKADTGFVVEATNNDLTGMCYKYYWLNVSGNGSVTDTVSYTDSGTVTHTTLPGSGGVELSTGKFLFNANYAGGVTLFDRHFNYLYTLPDVFPELVYNWWTFHSNSLGGAYCNASVNVSTGHERVFANNFDSSFNFYPVLVEGDVIRDNNYNCTYNTGDLRLAHDVTQLHNTGTGQDFYGFGDDTGHYVGNVPLGSYTVTHHNPSYLATECGGYSYTFTAPTTITGADFADTVIPGINELSISLYSGGYFSPGDTSFLYAYLHNNGTTNVDSPVTIVLDSRVTVLNSLPTATSVSGASYTYNVHLAPDSSKFIRLQVVSSTSVTFGDTLIFSANSGYRNTYISWADSPVYTAPVMAAYDPNFKSVNQPYLFDKKNTLVYTIGFENLGNAPAKNVVVQDTLDTRLDPATFKLLGSTHALPTVQWMTGNKIMFTFANIYLPDSASNPDGSHGTFTFAINTKSSVPLDDTIRNKAYIYFDYNTAIITNTTENVLKSLHSTGVHQPGNYRGISCYPNPAQNEININVPVAEGISVAVVTDLTGRTIAKQTCQPGTTKIALDIPNGLYLLKVTNLQTGKVFTSKFTIVK